MQETKRTLIFVGMALVAVALAGGTHWAMRPVSLDQFSDVGEEFYPDFADPNAATVLRVAAYNEDAARVDVFNVEFKDGLWRIPSHHNYPADGEDRLANTATSIIGIEREAVASTSADDFRRLGVLDPLDETVTGTEGRGDRITLLDGDNVLADYIIGNKVEDQENVYNVRRPDENRTYRAALDIDISTKFADWIEPGLLDVRRADLREIDIDRYSVDETRGVLVPGDISRLTRASSTDSWVLEGLQDGEELKTGGVDSIINALEDLEIVGVRAKPPGLSADLKGDGAAQLDTIAYLDLQDKGYFIDRQGQLVSNEGEVRVGTAEGVQYVLRFGEVFTGSDVAIEVGQSAATESDTQPDDENADSENADAEDADGENAAEDDDDDADKSQKQSRYLFITTQFDKSLLEAPSEKPVKPEKPAAVEETPPENGANADDEQPADETKTSSDETKSDSDDTAPAEGEKDEDGDDSAADPQQEEYEQALTDYESRHEQWERDQKAYEEKHTKGRERVDELNARFADWYYVISAASFDDIRVPRADLVEAKEPDEDVDAETGVDAEAPALPVIEGQQPAASGGADSETTEPLPPIDEETLPPADPNFAPPLSEDSSDPAEQ